MNDFEFFKPIIREFGSHIKTLAVISVVLIGIVVLISLLSEVL